MDIRREYTGTDKGGEYTYYDIIDYNECYNCPCFYDNKIEERFECVVENCIRKCGNKNYEN